MGVDCEDHPILDAVAEALKGAAGADAGAEHVTRESECVEFYDSMNGQWYEVVVRPIDRDEDE